MKVKQVYFIIIPLFFMMMLPLWGCGSRPEVVGKSTEASTTSWEDLETKSDNVTVSEKKEIEKVQIPALQDDEKSDQEVKRVLASMTLEEKILQMFFITPEALTGYSKVTAAGDITKSALDAYPVGGLIYFAPNLESPEQTKKMLLEVYDYAIKKHNIPIFLGVDEEGGRVARIGNNDAFGVEKVPSMGKLAKSGGSDAVYEAAKTIGAYLSELGFNVDFAPDADVITNPKNKVIGDRSFGTEPEAVSDMAWRFCNGLRDSGVLAAYKHFPGHGGTQEDSHTEYAYSYKTLEQLKENELIPFQSGSDKGVDFILVSHISVPAVTGDDTPASLSSIWINDILKEQMGYDGIVITDSLAMGAIVNHYSSAEATLLAVKAGCDMIMIPQDFKSAYSALLNAVKDGDIEEERIDESVSRILKVKMTLPSIGS